MNGGGWRLARPVLGIAALGLVLLSVDMGAVADRLAGAQPWLVAAGVLGLTATHLIGALTWRSLVADLGGVRLPWWEAVRLHYGAQAIGGVTPANLGGDVHRAVAMRSTGHGWRAAVTPLVVQRATSYLALSLLSLLALPVVGAAATGAAPIVVIGGVVGLGTAGGALLLLPGVGGSVGGWVRRRLRAEPSGTEAPPSVGRSVAVGTGLGLVFHAAAIGFTWLVVAAVDPSLPVWPVLGALAIARLSLAVPITPSGIGIQEGVLALLFTQLGLPATSALAGLLLARLALVLVTVIGAVWLLDPRRAATRTPEGATPHRG